MKPTMQNLRRVVARLGGTIDDDGIGYGHITVDAPHGKVWSCDKVHGLAVHWHTDDAGRACPVEWKNDAIEDVLDRIAYGVEDCEIDDCEICCEECEECH